MIGISSDEYVEIMQRDLPDDFPLIADIAFNQLNNITGGRLAVCNIPDCCIGQVKKAICMQICYIDTNGGVDAFNEENISSVSIGKFSYSAGSIRPSAGSISSMALQYLYSAGLMYRAVGVIR